MKTLQLITLLSTAISLTPIVPYTHAAQCSALQIVPALAATVEPSEIQRVLVARLNRLADRKVLTNTAVTYLSRAQLSLELPVMACEEARAFFLSYLAQATRVEVGLVGTAPVFATTDFDPIIETTDSAVILRVRDEVVPRMRMFSASNLGKKVFVRLAGAKEPYVIEIRGINNTGVIAIPIDHVPEGFRQQPRLLVTELRVVSCGKCEGGYPGQPGVEKD